MSQKEAARQDAQTCRRQEQGAPTPSDGNCFHMLDGGSCSCKRRRDISNDQMNRAPFWHINHHNSHALTPFEPSRTQRRSALSFA
ncbi:hypothetical protein Acid7E03_39270 [Acidisoma sp. 7E03]